MAQDLPAYVPRVSLAPLPKLGADANWTEWKQTIEDRMHLYKFGNMLTNATATPANWPAAKQILLTAVQHCDSNLVRDAPNLKSAMTALEQQYAPNKQVLALTLKADLYNLHFQANESVPTLINRARTIASHLSSSW